MDLNRIAVWLNNRAKARSKEEDEFESLILEECERRRRVHLALICFSKRSERRYWMNLLRQNWFDDIWRLRGNVVVASLFKNAFRMTPPTFEYILDLVRNPLSRESTVFREAVSIEKRVAICLWRLATGQSYRSVGKVFGVSKESCCVILMEFCAVLNLLAPQFIVFPVNAADLDRNVLLFRRLTKFAIPQIAGAIDCTHVKVRKPSNEIGADYFNRKQTYSVNTQAVVGENVKFLDVETGYPGSMHDARVLRNSAFGRNANRLLESPTRRILGRDIKPMILGDGAYPPFRWLLKPFARHRHLTRRQRKFNRCVSSARAVVERAFGLLKMRWRCLNKKLEVEIENVPAIIIACCVLHNICQDRNEAISEDDERMVRRILANEREFDRVVRNNRRANDCNELDLQRMTIAQFIE